mmetsp:Transcript_52466/g.71925  ORF Transcript_52466/g.71925 Transcript_52466/m.71925 type:complete len:84 (-) Transcript_52466:81-332(-)
MPMACKTQFGQVVAWHNLYNGAQVSAATNTNVSLPSLGFSGVSTTQQIVPASPGIRDGEIYDAPAAASTLRTEGQGRCPRQSA